MKIGIYNLENKYINLALEKIRIYYQNKGDQVENYKPLMRDSYDKIYASSIFQWTGKKYVPKNAIIGGTGFNLNIKLPQKIEKIKPHLNFGFTTRGCNRNCKFCVVPKKEGKIMIYGDLLDLWDGISDEIKLLDNNILFLPDHFEKICNQAIKYNLKLDFNQGLDARLLNKKIIQLMKSIKHKQYRFAFDNLNDYKKIEKALKLLQENGIKTSTWYVLVGFDNDHTIMPRLDLLKKYKQDAFVQIFNNKNRNKYIKLSRWVNIHPYFRRYTFNEFLEYQKNRKRIQIHEK